VKNLAQTVAQDLCSSGARATRGILATPAPPPLSLRSWRYAQMGALLGSVVTSSSGCGQVLLGVPRKAPLFPLVFWFIAASVAPPFPLLGLPVPSLRLRFESSEAPSTSALEPR